MSILLQRILYYFSLFYTIKEKFFSLFRNSDISIQFQSRFFTLYCFCNLNFCLTKLFIVDCFSTKLSILNVSALNSESYYKETNNSIFVCFLLPSTLTNTPVLLGTKSFHINKCIQFQRHIVCRLNGYFCIFCYFIL